MRYSELLTQDRKLKEAANIPASNMNERTIREHIRHILPMTRRIVGNIGDVRVSMANLGDEQFFILSRDKIAYGFAELRQGRIEGIDGFYVTYIGLLTEMRWQGTGLAFYKMLLDRGYTLFSGATQTPDGAKVWQKLKVDPCVEVRETKRALVASKREQLTEGLAAAGKLYHGTEVQTAARILLADKLVGTVTHKVLKPRRGQTSAGVSLTRSFRFAVDWKGGAGVIFELNGDKLRAHYRLIPFDYYMDRRESEEFVPGTIQPLSAYLTAIYMSPETEAYCIEHDENLIEGHKDYEGLLNHPLLHVQQLPKQVPYVNPRA